MPQVEITFTGGIQSPPQLGTFILKPTTEGKMSYGQNISLATDIYGNGVLVPGPTITNFSGATSLANPVYWKSTNSQDGKMWVGYNGTSTYDYIDTIGAGGTPAYTAANTVTISIGGHTPITQDMTPAQYQGTSNMYTYVTLSEVTGGNAWAYAFETSAAHSSPVALSSNTSTGVVANPLPMIRTQFDGNIYVGNGQYIDRINPNNGSFASGTTLKAIGTSGSAVPFPWFITAMGEWNGLLVAAANNEGVGDFSKRNGGGQSRVFFWDIANAPTANYKTNFVNSPSHYISVLFTDLDGNLLAFGGVDEGRTTIYQYNGYGFLPLFTYIGDMPRNRHSVCFDAQGRLMWQTVNGEICRLDISQLTPVNDEEQSGIFEHLNTIQTGGQGTGGILGNLQTGGYEFVVSAGALLSHLNIALFAGTSGSYSSMIPLTISGIQTLPQKSIIKTVTVTLNKALQQAESLDVNYYAQGWGFLAGTNIGNLSYANDGAVASKQIRTSLYDTDEAAFGVAWLNSNGTSTAPGVLKMTVDYNQITTT